MRFKDPVSENLEMRDVLGIILGLGSIFVQIWLLSSSVHSYFLGNTEHLEEALFLSGLSFFCCLLVAITTFKRVHWHRRQKKL